MRPRPNIVDLASVLALWLASTAAYFAAGVRFDASPFPGYMQFIDGQLLRERLLESIWYSHAHPPGLNLLVGTAYKAFGDSAPVFLALVFHALGALLAVAVFALTLRLTRSRAAGYVCTALLVFSPGFVLYENWLMYTFLEAVLLTASAVALYKTLDRASSAWANRAVRYSRDARPDPKLLPSRLVRARSGVRRLGFARSCPHLACRDGSDARRHALVREESLYTSTPLPGALCSG